MSSQRKVLFVAYIFPPLARAGVHRTVRFVRYLPEMGWDLTVLTADEKYYPKRSPIDRELLKKIPAGVCVESTHIFHGTEHLMRIKDMLRGRRSARLRPKSPQSESTPRVGQESESKPKAQSSGKRSPSRIQKGKDFIYDLFTIPDKDVNWLPYALPAALRLHRHSGFDLIYSTAPPFTDHLVAYLAKKITGLPWVADFRDPWARAPWKSEILGGTLRGKAADRLERQFVLAADRVILNTEWIRREFIQHYGPELEHKFTVIPNGFDPQDFAGISPAVRKNRRLLITHTGALYRKRDPQSFFKACENLLARKLTTPEELEIRFVGGIAPDLYRSFECSPALQQVIHVLPPVSHRQALEHQLESDVLLIVQPATSVSVPGKIFEYIGMRKKVLALTPAGATADVVREHNLGSVVDPDDLAGIEASLLGLLQEFRSGGIRPPSTNGAFRKFDGVALTQQLHHEFLRCLGHG